MKRYFTHLSFHFELNFKLLLFAFKLKNSRDISSYKWFEKKFRVLLMQNDESKVNLHQQICISKMYEYVRDILKI